MRNVYVLRHAEKDTTGELTERGRQHARLLGRQLQMFTVVIASPSARAVETAANIAGIQPVTDIRAAYLDTSSEVSAAILELALKHSISFLEAAEVYSDGELAQGLRRQAEGLNQLVDETLHDLGKGKCALIVSHDMTMVPAMTLHSLPKSPLAYLSGFICSDNNTVVPFDPSSYL